MSLLKSIPGVDSLLNLKEIKTLISLHGREVVLYSIRNSLNSLREKIKEKKKKEIIYSELISGIEKMVRDITSPEVKPVINATGIILHTNLGRAPLGDMIFENVKNILSGYSNIEFDLGNGKRGKRGQNILELLRFVTKAENAIIVNNNAAAVMLVLNTFANRKEVIISRGELVEIGGSFRMPDVMKASGAKMIEIGTTNRTRISDYEKAITDRTKIIFKAHKSNFFMDGFTEEVGIDKLSAIAKKHNLILIYDLGSGLLKDFKNLSFGNEPNVTDSLKKGADIVTFSCDKLLGGPQAGIIAGRADLIKKLSKSPLMRVLRVDKITIAILAEVLKKYLSEKEFAEDVPAIKMLKTSKSKIKRKAHILSEELKKYKINSEIIPCEGKCGGGTLPNLNIPSFAVKLNFDRTNKNYPQKVFERLLQLDNPVLGILVKGNLQFDMLTVSESDLIYIAKSVRDSL